MEIFSTFEVLMALLAHIVQFNMSSIVIVSESLAVTIVAAPADLSATISAPVCVEFILGSSIEGTPRANVMNRREALMGIKSYPVGEILIASAAIALVGKNPLSLRHVSSTPGEAK